MTDLTVQKPFGDDEEEIVHDMDMEQAEQVLDAFRQIQTMERARQARNRFNMIREYQEKTIKEYQEKMMLKGKYIVGN